MKTNHPLTPSLIRRGENLIIQKVTGLSKEQLFLGKEINIKQKKEINILKNRLDNWEPIEYIINNAEFYWLDFYVDNRCLIPRNDTEIMVDSVLKEVQNNKKWTTLIDVWTWSSCIPISIIKNSKNINKCFVIDISKKALEVSKINLEKYSLENKVTQLNWDLLDNFSYKLEWKVIITANLPYIKNWDFENMDKQTIEYEPDLALYWWEKTGFELYEKLIAQTFELKKKYNIEKLQLFIEIGFDQKEVSINYLSEKKLKFEIFKDNSLVDRCIKIDF